MIISTSIADRRQQRLSLDGVEQGGLLGVQPVEGAGHTQDAAKVVVDEGSGLGTGVACRD
ncbi:hypothetical protein ASE25_05915 [Terrabacter sp. Root85]|nr:hypothetical protein ASE25_05915 [Terrabacter sp. Root85]